jgi:Tol biopolymer transport system component
MFRRTLITVLLTLTILVNASCSYFAQPEASRPTPLAPIPTASFTPPESSGATALAPSPTTTQEMSVPVRASEGGKVTLSDKTTLTIPPGSLQKDTQISVRKATVDKISPSQQELVAVGNAYDIDLGSSNLAKPATLEIPFDPVLLPADVNPNQVFLSYYDEKEKEWIYAGGKVDTTRNVIVIEITHASWWMPTTWNWSAWIAVLNKFLRISIVEWIEAVQLLTDDCPQSGKYVHVDSRQARNVVQGCVERDDVKRPELRVVNPKSFFFEVRPVAGGNNYPTPALLAPGEDLKFEASIVDPSPLVIEAQMTQKAGWYLVVHMVISMLPGANQFGIQGHHVACITERLADVSYFASAVEALLISHNGAAAAENISEFMLDGDAVRRFIAAADDCNFGPAPTWSPEGIRQIGGAVSTIMSATDYIANYFAGNINVRVSFVWNRSDGTVELTNGLIAYIGLDGNIWLISQDGKNARKITHDAVTTTSGPVYYSDLAWSPNGEYLAFIRQEEKEVNSAIQFLRGLIIYDVGKERLKDFHLDIGSLSWKPDSSAIAFNYFSGEDKGIWLVDINDGQPTKLISERSDWPLAYPSWSPNGRYLAFGEMHPEINEGRGHFAVYDFQTKSYFWWGEAAGNYTWAPDSEHIIYDRQVYLPGIGEHLWRANIKGTTRTPLTRHNASTGDYDPKFSPSGDKIAFLRGTFELFLAPIWIMDVNGGSIRQITSFEVDDAVWSPDGQKLAVWRGDEILILDVVKGETHKLADGISPAWQPRFK